MEERVIDQNALSDEDLKTLVCFLEDNVPEEVRHMRELDFDFDGTEEVVEEYDSNFIDKKDFNLLELLTDLSIVSELSGDKIMDIKHIVIKYNVDEDI